MIVNRVRGRSVLVGAHDAAQEIVYADIDGSLLDSVRTALPISKQRRHDVYMTVAVEP